jgi:hypothetical protein
MRDQLKMPSDLEEDEDYGDEDLDFGSKPKTKKNKKSTNNEDDEFD